MANYTSHKESELFDSIRKNDKQAFAELFNRYWRKAYVIAYSKIQNRQITQEIVQELFIQLWEKRSTLTIHNFSSYLYTSVKNKCINYIESTLVQKRHWDYYKTFLQSSSAPADNEVAYNDLMDAIMSGMEYLPQKTQKVFQLNRLEGRSIPEIAETLNLSEKAIEYHLSRSLKQLRLHLKDFILPLLLVSLLGL